MVWLYDSHIHLADPEYDSYLNHVLINMKNMKIKACVVSVDVNNSKQTLQLSQKNKLIFPFLGIHPQRAEDNLEVLVDLIIKNHSNIAGIGEIGLDDTYVTLSSPKTRQIFIFEKLLELAEKFDKPVSIHSRKTLNEIYEIISSFNISKVSLHWFDGNKKQLRTAMDLDYFVSYGPVMIYANDKQNLLAKTRHDKILLETDGPVSFSHCFGHKPAQISFIPSVVFYTSKILKMSYDDTARLLERNSKDYLGI